MGNYAGILMRDLMGDLVSLMDSESTLADFCYFEYDSCLMVIIVNTFLRRYVFERSRPLIQWIVSFV